jgi:predicted nucleotidyltransferase
LKEYREVIDLDGISVKTINLEGLLKTKQTLRDKDTADKLVLAQALAIIKSKTNK